MNKCNTQTVNLLLNRYRENNPNSSYLVIESGNTSDENDRISTEEFGNLLVLKRNRFRWNRCNEVLSY